MTEKHHRNGKNEKITATALTNRTLILFKYFWETTDEAHPISLTDISAHLKEHGITADPRTLRNDIEQLVEFGVDIVKERRVQNLYCRKCKSEYPINLGCFRRMKAKQAVCRLFSKRDRQKR